MVKKLKRTRRKHKWANCLHQMLHNFKNGYNRAKENNREEKPK